jgi:flavin reductase (DIM6/NTAB) family NADH-FMN oxidoreductase RutF
MSQLHITQADLLTYSRFYRANLINSISGYKPAMLIGTCNAGAQTNLAIFSSIVHLGADPALIGFIQRPVGQSGDTWRNIMATGVYTINHVHRPFVHRAHTTSARFAADVSEFDVCRFTPAYLPGFAAPFVAESQVRLGLQFVEAIPIRHNNTQLIIGEVAHLLLPGDILQEDGNLRLADVEDVCVSGLEQYHTVQPYQSFPYAKADQIPQFEI